MSTAVLDFVITEHPPATTPGLERDYEIIRRRIERLAGVPVRSRHYCDAGDFAAAMILSGSFAPWELYDPASLACLGEHLRRFDGAVLGICGGMPLLTIFAGGAVGPRERPAIGYRTVEVLEGGDLLNGLGSTRRSTSIIPVTWPRCLTSSRCWRTATTARWMRFGRANAAGGARSFIRSASARGGQRRTDSP
jgi:hypothetical protein